MSVQPSEISIEDRLSGPPYRPSHPFFGEKLICRIYRKKYLPKLQSYLPLIRSVHQTIKAHEKNISVITTGLLFCHNPNRTT
jgi:hypothetical protein